MGPAVAVVLGAGALGGWVASQSPHSTPTRWTIVAVLVGYGILAIAVGRGHQRLPSAAWLAHAVASTRNWGRAPHLYALGVAVWVVLLVAIAAWDLNSFLHQSHDLPTLSYYIGKVTRYGWGRGLAFVAWLAIGAWFLLAWRRER